METFIKKTLLFISMQSCYFLAYSQNSDNNKNISDNTTSARIENSDNPISLYSLEDTASNISTDSKNVIVDEQKTEDKKDAKLEEVIVVGYGTQRRKDLTSSIARVDMEELSKAAVRSFDEALQGRVAGVQISSADGQPGASVNIVIRGNSSATQDNSPLYVIDGFPTEAQDLNAINPKDIESIDILKDASATAIYGSRAANGVVMVTLKKGSLGPTVINFSTFAGFQDVIQRQKLMNAADFVKYQLERDTTIGTYKTYFGGHGDNFYKDSAQTIDWQDKLYRTALMQSYSLSLSGGTAKTKFFISGSTLQQNGVVINSDYLRYQGKITLDQTVNNNVKVGVNLNYSYLEQTGIAPAQTITSPSTSGTNAPFYAVFGYSPVNINDNVNIEDDLLDPNVTITSDYRINPIINLKNLYRKNITNSTIANSYIELKMLKNLIFKSTAGINYSILRNEVFNDTNTTYGNPRFGAGITNGINGSIDYRVLTSLVNENTLRYDTKINKKHNIGVLVGMTEQMVTTSSSKLSATNIANGKLGMNSLNQGVGGVPSNSSSVSTLLSYLSRVTYGYQSRYLFTFTYRADGSSKFVAGNKWGFFPSGAVAWNFTDENFFKRNKYLKQIFSKGKIRTSYGAVGNNRVADFAYNNPVTTTLNQGYTFGSPLSVGSSVGNGNTGGAYVSANTQNSLGNQNLKWETTYQFDLGLDLSIFQDLIQFEIDIYDKTTSDLLLNAPIPLSSGYTSSTKNVGSIQNRGLEIGISTVNIKRKGFQWTSNFNISFNRNKILSLAEDQTALTRTVSFDLGWSSIPSYISKVGQPLGQIFGFVSDGIYQYSDFNKTASGGYVLKDNVATNGNARTSIQPGDIKYKDINGDGIVNSNDYTIIGSGVPIHTGGFTNNFSYKGISLSIFLQWSYGNNILNANRLVFEGNALNKGNLNQFDSYKDRWSPDNQYSKNFRANGFFGGGFSSRYVEDGSYIRVKTINLSYNFPDKWLTKVFIKNVKVYVSGQNLYTITKYSGFDPEVSAYGSALTPGFDYSTYPRARTFVFGLDMTL